VHKRVVFDDALLHSEQDRGHISIECPVPELNLVRCRAAGCAAARLYRTHRNAQQR